MHLEVTVVRCKDIPKVQRIGKQDPYVILKYGTQKFRTKTDENGGEDPKFNELFVFSVDPGSTALQLDIFNDKRRQDELIASTRVDFGSVLMEGQSHKTVPVHTASGSPHGTIELHLKCPEALAGQQVAHQISSMQIAGQQDRYNQALSAARDRYYSEIPKKVEFYKDLCSEVKKEHAKGIRSLKEDEQSEMDQIFKEPKEKAAELVQLVAKEAADTTAAAVSGFRKAMSLSEESAKFARQSDTFLQLVGEADRKRAERFGKAETALLGTLEEALKRYRAHMKEAYEGYDSDFGGAAVRFRTELEESMKTEAEQKAKTEAAAATGGAPPAAPSAPPPVVAAPAPPPPVAAPPAPYVPPPAAYTPPPPAYHAPPPAVHPPQGYPAPPPHYAPPAYAPPMAYPGYPPQGYPPPAGYPMTEAERARMEAEKAKSDARSAEAAAQKAQMEAAAAKQQSAQTQQMMQQQQQQQARGRAVRRGVVGGIILAKVIR